MNDTRGGLFCSYTMEENDTKFGNQSHTKRDKSGKRFVRKGKEGME